jgi:hypothetical protein
MFLSGAWRSPVARMLWEHDVAGSNPAAPTRQKEGCSLLQPFFYTLICGESDERLSVNVFDAFTGLTIHCSLCTFLRERLKNGTRRIT